MLGQLLNKGIIMLLAKIKNNVISVADHQQFAPHTSFPRSGPSVTWVSNNNLYYVYDTKTHDADTQRLESCGPYLENGVVYTVSVVDKSDESLAAQYRARRDELLAATDWRFRSDLTPSQAWIDYCATLRDVPQQDGFPHSIVWPEKPND